MSILLVPLTLLCAAVWVRIVAPRLGRFVAVPAVGALMLLGIVALLLVTPLVPTLPLGMVVAVALSAATAAGVVGLVRGRGMRWPTSHSLALWLPALSGAVVWVAVRAASFLVPGASTVSWAMEGDAANNLHQARSILEDNGIVLGPDQNPVPLVAGLIALPLSLDRAGAPGASLDSELHIFAAVWTVFLAACCVAMGVVAASLLDPRRRALVVVVSAGGSMLPLTWLVSGLPVVYGYLNVHLVLPLLLASWLAYLGARRSAVAATGVLAGLTALVLMTWSPVVLIPVALGALVVARHRHELVARRRSVVAVIAPGVVIVALVAAGLTIPAFFAQADALAAPGHGFPAAWLIASGLAAVALLAAAASRRRIGTDVFAGATALVVSAYAALASTFYVARDLFDPWNAYYPVKLAWLVAVLLLPVAASLLIAAGAALRRPAVRTATVVVTAALVAAFAVAPPLTTPVGQVVRQPADRILGGHVWTTGDAAADIVVALSRRDGIGILWRSASPDEALINFWAMDADGGALDGDRVLRDFAFKEYKAYRSSGDHDVFGANALCTLLRDRDYDIVVYTDDPALEGDLDETCTGAEATFVVGSTPGVVYPSS